MKHEKEEQLLKERPDNLVANTDAMIVDIKARLKVLEERQKCGWTFQQTN